jgi:hypothetical protein
MSQPLGFAVDLVLPQVRHRLPGGRTSSPEPTVPLTTADLDKTEPSNLSNRIVQFSYFEYELPAHEERNDLLAIRDIIYNYLYNLVY